MSQRCNNTHGNRAGVQGFTLVETIVALSLGVLIVLGTTQVFIGGLSHIRGVRTQALLTSDAQYMVQMIRNELFKADCISVDPNPGSSVTMTSEEGTSRTFAVVGGQMVFDDAGATSSVTQAGVSVSDDKVFTKVGESLRVQFTLNSGPRTNKTFMGQTTLALRSICKE